ncbi:uncharacterized protein LOC120334119 [Styela clava]
MVRIFGIISIFIFALYWAKSIGNNTCQQPENERRRCRGRGQEEICVKLGCWWCPDLKPRCVRGAACAKRPRENCWKGPAGMQNREDCRKLFGCSWCPWGYPKCVKDFVPTPTSASITTNGTTLPTITKAITSTTATQTPSSTFTTTTGTTLLPTTTIPNFTGTASSAHTTFSITTNMTTSLTSSTTPTGTTPPSELWKSTESNHINGSSYSPLTVSTTPISSTAPKTTTSSATFGITTEVITGAFSLPTTLSLSTTPVKTSTYVTDSSATNTTEPSSLPFSTTAPPTQISSTTATPCPVGHIRRYKQDTCCAKHARIMGGEKAEGGQWPWMGVYMVRGYAVCGAVLIDAKYAVSAAHCIGAGKNYVKIKFGVTDILGEEDMAQIVDVEDIILHEEYIPNYLNSDIMLLMLKDKVLFNKLVQPVSLPLGENTPIGTRCFVTGWGRPYYNAPDSSQDLMEVGVDIMPFEICAHSYSSLDVAVMRENEMICAGRYEGNHDACQGDSGGPLVCQRCSNCDWYLAGIVSFGIGCGSQTHPGIYTKVVSFEQWLYVNGVPTASGKFEC